MIRDPIPERQEPARERHGVFLERGLAPRLNWILGLYAGTNGVLSSQFDRDASLIASLNQQKADWEVRRADKQQGLQEARFTGLETALSQLQSQGRWLSGRLSGLCANTS